MSRFGAAAGLGLLLAGCSSEQAGIFGQALLDELRGPPDAAELAVTARFEGAGIRFEHPAVLRLRHAPAADGEGEEWSLEYGMFSLELEAAPAPMRAETYLGMLSELFADGRSLDAGEVRRGAAETVCGHAIRPVLLDLRMMGDRSRMEAFDLPAPEGGARLLVFDDELVDGQPSALGRATRERVLASLHCDPAFHPAAQEAEAGVAQKSAQAGAHADGVSPNPAGGPA